MAQFSVQKKEGAASRYLHQFFGIINILNDLAIEAMCFAAHETHE
jgi:hypothetical protein